MMAAYVDVHVEPVTAENLRTFATVLNDMADKLDPPASASPEVVERLAINQNDAMRQELAHVGNLVSDLACAMGVDQANPDGSWPDLAGRIQTLTRAALSIDGQTA